MSISGESKTIMMQAKMEDTAKQLDVAIESMNKINAQTEKNIDELSCSIEELGNKIEGMPEHIAKNTAIQIKRYNNLATARNQRWIENDK